MNGDLPPADLDAPRLYESLHPREPAIFADLNAYYWVKAVSLSPRCRRRRPPGHPGGGAGPSLVAPPGHPSGGARPSLVASPVVPVAALASAVGDRLVIRVAVPDRRWWRRLWCWLLLRPAPSVMIDRHVTVASATTTELHL